MRTVGATTGVNYFEEQHARTINAISAACAIVGILTTVTSYYNLVQGAQTYSDCKSEITKSMYIKLDCAELIKRYDHDSFQKKVALCSGLALYALARVVFSPGNGI